MPPKIKAIQDSDGSHKKRRLLLNSTSARQRAQGLLVLPQARHSLSVFFRRIVPPATPKNYFFVIFCLFGRMWWRWCFTTIIATGVAYILGNSAIFTFYRRHIFDPFVDILKLRLLPQSNTTV